jgi:hypothetical protein
MVGEKFCEKRNCESSHFDFDIRKVKGHAEKIAKRILKNYYFFGSDISESLVR